MIMPLDALRSLGARVFLNKYVEFLGEILEVDIDPASNQATLLMALKGEPHPMELHIRYRLEDEALVLVSFACERAWIENTLNRFFGGKRFDMGDGLTQALIKSLL
jgi:hypothetical protein